MSETVVKRNSRLLDSVEKIGNKMPHPFVLFLWLTVIVIILSAVCSVFGVTAVHPGTGEVVEVQNFLSTAGLQYFVLNFVNNFQGMYILGSVLLLSIASGICEETGFFAASIRSGMKNAKGVGVVALVSFIGVFANTAGDVAWILVPPLAAIIYYSAGRNPIAGIFSAYAAVGGGFSTEFIPSYDVLIVPVTNQAAQMIDPNFKLPYLTGYYIMFVSGIMIVLLNTIVTIKVIEPRLGKYTGTPEGSLNDFSTELTENERKGIRRALIALLVYVMAIVVCCIPQNSFLRSETGSLIFGAPLMDGIMTLLLVGFTIPGIVYGVTVKKITCFNDLFDILTHAAQGIAPFLVMLVAISQFVNIFSATNLGVILAVNGANFLRSLSMPTAVLAICVILFVAFINLFIGSASTKWLLLGPIFIPMLMQLNIHPAFTQVLYRMGDCATNHLTPLMAYMMIMLNYCKKYDKDVGLGTVIANMAPYSLVFLIGQCMLAVIWIVFNLPVGINGTIYLA